MGVPVSKATPTAVAKLRPPVEAGRLIQRRRLVSLLNDTVEAELTTVVAPAGSGKTSLVASWAAQSSVPVAWLSLEDTDREFVQLWMGVIAALETLAPGCGRRALSTLRRTQDRARAVPTLLQDLDSVSRTGAVLAIDDVHVVDEAPENATSLALFLQGLPPWLHAVVSSRRTPLLPIDRLRARGQLGEVSFAELRFSQEEAADLLRQLAPGMSDTHVAEAASRADGWAASLRLSAVASRSRQARPAIEPPGEEGDLMMADYLWHEMLTNENPEVVHTLQSISVVDRVDASLAACLADRPDAEGLLQLAEARGLFVSRRAGTSWYGLHALMRELLMDDLAGRSPGRLSSLHARAAAWYEEHDEIALALEHWLQGDRPREALRLLATGNVWLSGGGRESLITRTLAAIPIGVATSDLQAMAEYAWCHVLIDRQRFLELVGQLTRWRDQSPGCDPALMARIRLLDSISRTFRGEWAEGERLARQALAGIGPERCLDPVVRFGWNMVARDIALSERWDDDEDEVAEIRQALSVDPEGRVAFEGTRALGEALAGHPVDALRVAAGVRGTAEVTNLTILSSELSIAEAVAHRELGDRSRALGELGDITARQAEAPTYVLILAQLELVSASLDVGDLAAARSTFGHAEELVRTECNGSGTRGWLARAGVLVALAGGEVADARGWAAQIEDPHWAAICTAQVLMAENDAAGAQAALDAQPGRSVRQRVIAHLLLARASRTPEAAMKHVINAIEPASAHGLIQTVASEGPDAIELVEMAAWRAPAQWLDRLRRAATPAVDATMLEAATLVETLTDREREVLRLLPSRLTLREIASELGISGNTLKFHLKVVYRKLGCGSRAEAAEAVASLARVRRSPHVPSTLRR